MKNISLLLFSMLSFGQSNVKLANDKKVDGLNFVEIWCPHYLFDNVAIKQFNNLDSVSDEIAKKAWGYLENHATRKNLKKIHFISGREKATIEKSPDFFVNKTKYYLCFSFSDKQKGIKNYGIYVELDSNGNLVNKINLPNCNDDSKCFNIKKLSSVKKSKHYKEFFNENQTKVELEVNFELNIFCWKFINEKYEPNGVFIIDELFFNAYNGKFLVRQQRKGEWVE